VVRAARRKGAARSYPCGPEVGRLLTVLSSSRGHRKRRAIGRVVLMLGWLIQPSSVTSLAPWWWDGVTPELFAPSPKAPYFLAPRDRH
jgi:hypothetical protein